MSAYNSAVAYYSDDEEQEEMPTTERELADDAQWKLIQKNTFTRWCNEHLKTVNKNLNDLEFDLSDGLRLIALVEVLANYKFPRINKRPNLRPQKLENVTMVLKFLEIDEEIKIVNIDSTDIVDGKLKLILGLIWALIRHYFISMPQWHDEPKSPSDKDLTPKQRLMQWVQGKMPPEKPVKNFSTDWNDGTAIGALVDSIAPGLCPDWPDWNPKENLRNATEAMDAADTWLDVPQLIKPKEMCNPKVDEQSVMTYLSQFPNAKLKDGAPLRNRADPSRVRAYGKGLEPEGNCVGGPAPFTVETFSAGSGRLQVLVINPKGQHEPIECRYNDDKKKTYSCEYTPTAEGEYRLIIKFNDVEVPKSPFRVKVEGAVGDPSKVTVKGPGILPNGPQAGKTTWFKVLTEGAGSGQVEVSILDPNGRRDTVRSRLTPEPDNNCLVEYAAQKPGLHTVHVTFGGKPVPSSPFQVHVSPAVDARQCYAKGRGIQPRGVRLDDKATFRVICPESAGPGKLHVSVTTHDGKSLHLMSRQVDAETTEYTYEPTQTGRYVVEITFGGEPIQKAPFQVEVGPFKTSRIRAYGPGLEGGVSDAPAEFTVETNGETGALGFAIEGPSQAKINCDDRGDGSADVSYLPTAAGEYAVHILCDDEDIPNSPFMAEILPRADGFDASKVRCSGPGLARAGVACDQPTEFEIDTTSAGQAPLQVTCHNSDHTPVNVKVVEKLPGRYTCHYKPTGSGRHVVSVTFGGLAVPNSPYRVFVSEPTRPENVRVYGPGVEGGVTHKEPTHFTVDCKDAGPGNVAMALFDEQGQDVPVKSIDNKDGTFRVEYKPRSVGTYTLSVLYAEMEIPNSPIRITVHPSVDLSRVKVHDLDDKVYLDSASDFTVDASSVTTCGEGKVRAIITAPSGSKQEATVENNGDGTYKVIYAPYEKGTHKIEVTYEGAPIPGSPFTVTALEGCDPSKVKAYGDGLQNGLTDEKQTFTIETRGAGAGALALGVEGPAKITMYCTDHKDGTCTAEYTPETPGDYDIIVKFADQDIRGSPFPVRISRPVDASQVRVTGEGVGPGVRAGQPSNFHVDTKDAGDAPLTATVTDRSGRKQEVEQRRSPDGNSIDCSYTPREQGPLSIDVNYGGQPVPGSPFETTAAPAVDPDKVQVSGPALERALASLPTSLDVDTKNAGDAELAVNVQAPDGTRLPVDLRETSPGLIEAEFTPEQPGLYSVDVLYGGEPVPGAPFSVDAKPAGDPNKVQIKGGNQKAMAVNTENTLKLDCSRAGDGRIYCQVVSPTGSEVRTEVIDNGDGTYDVKYVPHELGDHLVSLQFGGQDVPGGNFKQKAVEEQEELVLQDHAQVVESVQSPSYVGAENLAPVEFKFRAGPVFNYVAATVKQPDDVVVEAGVEDNGDGTITLRYQPTQTGLHELHLSYNDEPVQGSPFFFNVDALDSGFVTANGPGLSHGVSGDPADFTIVTRDAGAGGLSLAVEGPSKAEIELQDNDDGTCGVSYFPTIPGTYRVLVTYNDEHISGSPFTAKITDPSSEAGGLAVGSSSEVPLRGVDAADLGALVSTIIPPSGHEEPCGLKKLPNGHMGISFTPKEVGPHEVHIKRNSKHVASSPFKIYVGESELGNSSKVRCYGDGLKEALVNEKTNFTVDTRDAGFGGLSLSIEGPSKADIHCEDQTNGRVNVAYLATEPGTYLVNVKFANQHVQGSPFTVRVRDPSGASQSEQIRKETSVTESAVGSECELSLRLPGTNPRDMTASVTTPSGETRPCEISPLAGSSSQYAVSFVPSEIGVHSVSVKEKGLHIPGSPFQFTVGPLSEGGAHKVQVAGQGLTRAQTGETAEFDVFTREAGAGGLSIAVEGPSKADIQFHDRKDGTCGVSYTVSQPGEYQVSIKFNDEHIPDSPFRAIVTSADGDEQRVTVGSLQDRGLETGKATAFTVNFNGAEGKLTARVVAPSGAEEEAVVQEIDSGRYDVRFVPKENGIHNMHVCFDGSEIPGSPFRLLVGSQTADPGLVRAHGEGLHRAKTGNQAEFTVDTSRAGSGALTVAVDGPSKVALNCDESGSSGYVFHYTPTAPGDYLISIKYGGISHIPGSPFKARVTGDGRKSLIKEQSRMVVETVERHSRRVVNGSGASAVNYEAMQLLQCRLGASDAAQVHAFGDCLNSATLGHNTFSVDCTHAGHAMLMVGVYGPGEDAVCEEVKVTHTGYKKYAVSYLVKERGQYIIMVKWGDEHIPGSPYIVDVR